MSWSELVREAAASHRVATPGMAYAHGVGRTTFDRRSGEEGWQQPFSPSGVRLLPGGDITAIERAAAALAHVGFPAALTRWSALHVLGVERRAPSNVQLLLPFERPVPTVPGIEVTRTRKWHAKHVREVEGLRCVSNAWLLTDLANVTTIDTLRRKAIDLRFRDDQVLGALRETHDERGRYRGRDKVGTVLRDLREDGSDSGFEFLVRKRLADLGLAPDTQQAEVRTKARTYRLDLAWSRAYVGTECLGWAYHGAGRGQWQRDIERTNEITTADRWRILHLTWQMLWGAKWHTFVDQLRRLLDGAR